MAEKKVIVITAGNASLANPGEALAGYMKKAVTLAQYTPGDVATDVMRIEKAVKASPEQLEELFANDTALAVVDLGNADAAALESAVAQAMKAADRRTLTVLVTDTTLCFHGLGITRGAEVARAATAQDIMPTVAYIAGLYLPADCNGAVLYQILKDPNAPVKELEKMQAALMRMEAALQRDNREPWDKHDCA